MDSIVWTVLGGLLTGIFAKALLREKRYGLILTTFVGLVGGLVGDYIARLAGVTPTGGFQSFAVAVIGAIVFLATLSVIRSK